MSVGNPSPQSIAESIVIKCLQMTGSTWVSRDDLFNYCAKAKLLSFMNVVNDSKIVENDGFFTTKTINEEENDIAINVLRLLFCSTFEKVDRKIIEHYVHEYEEVENGGKKLHYHQVDAVVMVVNNNFSVLTGGPGTGKTTVLTCINYVLRKLKRKIDIVFTAPTGKAARRITESTGENACTTHKQFNLGYDTKEAVLFDKDVLFCDESSMNDNEISAKTLKKIPTGKKVVWVGDTDQLPSVGIGAVLRDLIASNVIPVTMLTHTFRQDNSSKLFKNICNIRTGNTEIVEGDDYHTILLPDGESDEVEKAAIDALVKTYREQVKKYGVDNVVILLPYRRSKICSNKINNIVQQIVNPKQNGVKFYNEEDRNNLFFKEGDLVMQLENRDECANGDVGKVISCSSSTVTVVYGKEKVTYQKDELTQLALAYGMSIHKSQGSEYPSVIMCILEEHKSMLQRNLLYTGVTRAKKEVTLIYQKKAYITAIETIADAFRITKLKEKIQMLYTQYHMAYGV